MDQRIEEYLSVTLRQNERLMLGDGPSGRLGKDRQTEIGQAAPFKLGRPRHHLLCLTIQADAKARRARTVFFGDSGRPSARHIRSPQRKFAFHECTSNGITNQDPEMTDPEMTLERWETAFRSLGGAASIVGSLV